MIELIYKISKNIFQKSFVRFLVVGGINTIFGYSVFALLISMGIHYSLSVFLATVLGVLFNFKTIGVFVFKNGDNKLIFKFVCVYLFTYFFNVIGIKVLSEGTINIYFSGAIMILPSALLTYLLNRFFVYNKRGEE